MSSVASLSTTYGCSGRVIFVRCVLFHCPLLFFSFSPPVCSLRDPTRAGLLTDFLLATVTQDELLAAIGSRESMLMLVNWASCELHTPVDTVPFIADLVGQAAANGLAAPAPEDPSSGVASDGALPSPADVPVAAASPVAVTVAAAEPAVDGAAAAVGDHDDADAEVQAQAARAAVAWFTAASAGRAGSAEGAAALLSPPTLLPKLTASLSIDGSRSLSASGLGCVVDVTVADSAGSRSGSGSRAGSGSSREGSRTSALLLPRGNVLLGDAGCGVLRPLAQWSSSRSGSATGNQPAGYGAVIAAAASPSAVSSASSSRSATFVLSPATASAPASAASSRAATLAMSAPSAPASAPASAPTSRFSSAAVRGAASSPLPSAVVAAAADVAVPGAPAAAAVGAMEQQARGAAANADTQGSAHAATGAPDVVVLPPAAVLPARAAECREIGVMTEPMMEPLPPNEPAPGPADADAKPPAATEAVATADIDAALNPDTAVAAALASNAPAASGTAVVSEQPPQEQDLTALVRQAMLAGSDDPSVVGRFAEHYRQLLAQSAAAVPAPRGLCEVLWDMSGPCDPPKRADIHAMLTDLKKLLVGMGRHDVQDRFHVTAVRSSWRPGAGDFTLPPPPATAAAHDAGGGAAGGAGATGGAGGVSPLRQRATHAGGDAAAAHGGPAGVGAGASAGAAADDGIEASVAAGDIAAAAAAAGKQYNGKAGRLATEEYWRVTELTRNLVTIAEAGSGSRPDDAARACSSKMRERIGEIERRVQQWGLSVATFVVITDDATLLGKQLCSYQPIVAFIAVTSRKCFSSRHECVSPRFRSIVQETFGGCNHYGGPADRR